MLLACCLILIEIDAMPAVSKEPCLQQPYVLASVFAV